MNVILKYNVCVIVKPVDLTAIGQKVIYADINESANIYLTVRANPDIDVQRLFFRGSNVTGTSIKKPVDIFVAHFKLKIINSDDYKYHPFYIGNGVGITQIDVEIKPNGKTIFKYNFYYINYYL
jgi:hypothetical protein